MGGNLEKSHILNHNLEAEPQRHFHSWKCMFHCPFLEQSLSTGMEESGHFRTVAAVPGHALQTKASSVLLLLIALGFLFKQIINLIRIQWVIGYCSSKQLLLRIIISLKVRTVKLSLFERCIWSEWSWSDCYQSKT